MRALGPGAAFRESLALFLRRPLATLALGLALLSSLLAVCCGLGVVAAPWFLGELFALQIALGTGVRVVRTRAWLWAFAVQMVAVLILCAMVGLTLLSVGPDVVVGGSHENTASLASGVLRSIGLWLVAGGFTLVLTVYFEHVPALLLDRGGPLTAAMLESARLVAESGMLRTWFTSGIAHGLQLAPIVIGVAVTAAFGTLSSTMIWALFLLPLAALSLALGQGMVVASYLALRPHALDPARVPKQARLSTSRALLWTILLLCVLSGPLTVSGALSRPAQPRPGTPAQDGDLLDAFVATGQAKERFVTNTALTLQVSEARVRVKASDGGGAGTIPLPHVAVHSVRVLRPSTLPDEIRRDGLGTSIFAIEIALRDGRRFTTWVDDAGVRLDDSLTRRLSSLVPPWMMLALAGCLVWTAIWVALALPPQGRLRKRLSEQLSACDDHPSVSGELDRLLRRSALWAAAWLAPPAFTSLAIGLWAALGRGTLWP
jgi:hypothetical protein